MMFQNAILIPTRITLAYAARTSLLTARHLHASPVACKTATEKVTEVADKVNKSVGRGLESAIETGEQVTEKTKQTLGATKDRAADSAKSTMDKTKTKTRETSHAAVDKRQKGSGDGVERE
ncbi:hypothetical protein B0F90DRAFT_283385 [Multifurca ochricompacta]|uniref:Uncharacterized protein n=1 Tax=Multifurca ochricompacta TaxID=376703 RepID=A0AAD4LXI7_9AGAM|nr:hypothetical protein B0F90DRAFT_283385 [Multifurca ochricompacta]